MGTGYFRLIWRAFLGLALCACSTGCGQRDRGPDVPGGRPKLVFEVQRASSRTSFATVHFFEISSGSVRYPEKLEAYFRWQCNEVYIQPPCTIYAWPAGNAPHHGVLLLRREMAQEAALYYLDKRTGEEQFTLNPAAPL